MKNDVQERKALYAAVWRWHFYAGLYVAPFLILLAVTGLVMLAKGPIERWQLGALLTNTPTNTPGGSPVSHQARRFPLRRLCAINLGATVPRPRR